MFKMFVLKIIFLNACKFKYIFIKNNIENQEVCKILIQLDKNIF